MSRPPPWESANSCRDANVTTVATLRRPNAPTSTMAKCGLFLLFFLFILLVYQGKRQISSQSRIYLNDTRFSQLNCKIFWAAADLRLTCQACQSHSAVKPCLLGRTVLQIEIQILPVWTPQVCRAVYWCAQGVVCSSDAQASAYTCTRPVAQSLSTCLAPRVDTRFVGLRQVDLDQI